MMEPLVTLRQVSYFYPEVGEPALLDVNLVVASGEILGLVGATGAGKTTLCLALNGIVPQFHGGRFFGNAIVAGLDTADQPIHALAHHVGMVLQDPEAQIVTASVENEVAFTLENLALPVSVIRERVGWALDAVGLAGLESKHPHALSGGQRQRLAIAAALAMRPQLVVLDEPTSQLDPRATAEMFALVQALNREHGIAFVIASHAAEELAGSAHRLAVLSKGKIVAVGTPGEIYRDAQMLKREGLRAPEVTTVFAGLRRNGVYSGMEPVTLPESLPLMVTLPQERIRSISWPEPATAERPVLSLRGVEYVYRDGTAALRKVDLDVQRGDYLLLLGRNGAGKSTLLKCLLNLVKPTAGEILIDGQPLAAFAVSELVQRIGYIPQNPDRQLFNATVEEEVSFSLRAINLPEDEKQHRVEVSLAAMNLSNRRTAHPFSLAKGDRARVVIAAALIMQPEILIFDEPTTGQDLHGAHAILELTRELHAQGRTVLVVTHHLYLMPSYAQRVVILSEGGVRLDAPLRAAYHAVGTLRKAGLEPTQTVALAQALHADCRAVTPDELASVFDSP